MRLKYFILVPFLISVKCCEKSNNDAKIINIVNIKSDLISEREKLVNFRSNSYLEALNWAITVKINSPETSLNHALGVASRARMPSTINEHDDKMLIDTITSFFENDMLRSQILHEIGWIEIKLNSNQSIENIGNAKIIFNGNFINFLVADVDFNSEEKFFLSPPRDYLNKYELFSSEQKINRVILRMVNK